MDDRTIRALRVAIPLAILCVLGTGCQQTQAVAPVADDEPATPSIELRTELERAGHVVFRAWNGRALGMDNDIDLAFFSDGSVRMLEYGYVASRYSGKFQLERDGRLSVDFEGSSRGWPDMLVTRDDRSLLLASIVPGEAGAAGPDDGDEGSILPFRRLARAEEEEVLDELGW